MLVAREPEPLLGSVFESGGRSAGFCFASELRGLRRAPFGVL
jgi:hypothetical protein